MRNLAAVSVFVLTLVPGHAATAQVRAPMPIDLANSAEAAWLRKPVLATRLLDDATNPNAWTFTGTGKLTFPSSGGPRGGPMLRVDMDMFTLAPAPTRNRLSTVNLRRLFAGEDWSAFNRISLWIRPDVSGFPMLPIQIVMNNDGRAKEPNA